MANNLDFNIRLQTEQFTAGMRSVSSSVKSLEGSFSFLKKIFVGAVIIKGVQQITSAFVTTTKAANEQENAVNSLNAALKRSGEFTPKLSSDLQKFASDLQRTTTVGDETSIRMLALASSFGATADQAKTIVTASANLAAATGKSLDEAVRQVSKTLGGFAGELGEVNPAIKSLTKEQLQAGKAAEILNQQYSGAAAAEIKTFAGSVQQLSNSYGDLLEQIGFLFTQNPAFRRAIQGLGEIINRISGSIAEQSQLVNSVLVPVLKTLFKAIQLGSNLLNGFSVAINALKLGVAQDITEIVRKLEQFQNLVNKIPGVDVEIISEDAVKRFEAAERAFQSKLNNNIKEYQEANKFYQEIINDIDRLSKAKPIPVGQSGPTQPGASSQPTPEEKTKAETLGQFIFPDISQRRRDLRKAFGTAAGDFIENINDRMPPIFNQLGSTFITAIKQGGRDGAQSLLVGLAGAFGQFLGPVGQLLGPIVDLLATEGAAKMVSGLIDNIDKIIYTMAENLPILTTRLSVLLASPAFQVSIIKAFVTGLANGLKEAAGDIASKWATEFIDKVGPTGTIIAEQFGARISTYAKNFANDFAYQLGLLLPDIPIPEIKIDIPEPPWLKNLRKGVTNQPGIGGLSLPKFATGGVVPSGYPNDSYVARLTSGEEVLTEADRNNTAAKLDAILQALMGQNTTVNVMVDGQIIEQQVLKANKNNRRIS